MSADLLLHAELEELLGRPADELVRLHKGRHRQP